MTFTESHPVMTARTALEGRGDRRLIGVDASGTLEKTVDQVRRIAQFTAEAIGVDRELNRRRDHSGRRLRWTRHGIPDEQTIEAIRLVAGTEGMLTDPIYEGKSMAGLIGMVRQGRSPSAHASSTPTSVASPPSRPMPTRPGWAVGSVPLTRATCLRERINVSV